MWLNIRATMTSRHLSRGPLRVILFIFLTFYSICANAFYPCSKDRYLKPKSSFEVEIKNTGYAAQLAHINKGDDDSSLPESEPQSRFSQESGRVEIPLKPGMSILSTDENNLSYFVNVTIGDEEYPLVIDSGSAYLWVYGDSCKSDSCSSKKLFATKNVNKANGDQTFSLTYSSGVASGDVYEDRIIVNKLATTQNFTFGVADQVPGLFMNYPVSGIFGLPSNNSQNIESIISILSDSHAISTEKFSMIIGPVNAADNSTSSDSDDNTALTKNSGVFVIGDLQDNLYSGEVSYTPLLQNDNHYWQMKIDSVYVGSQLVNFSIAENVTGSQSRNTRSGIVDSGTTLLILPTQDALDLHTFFPKSVSDGTNFAIFCNSTMDIFLELNGVKWSISPKDYLGEPYSSDSYYQGYCVSNIQGANIDKSWILGDVFLKNKYAVFDVEKQLFGLANVNENAILVPYSNGASNTSGDNNINSTKTTLSSIASSTATSRKNSTSASTSTSSSKGSGSANENPKSFLIGCLALFLLAF